MLSLTRICKPSNRLMQFSRGLFKIKEDVFNLEYLEEADNGNAIGCIINERRMGIRFL